MTSKTVDKELAFLLMEFDTLPIVGGFLLTTPMYEVFKGLNCIYITLYYLIFSKIRTCNLVVS